MKDTDGYDIDDGAKCPVCDAPGIMKACVGCGLTGRIIDCGHMDQPRPLSPLATGEMFCDDCAEKLSPPEE